MNVTITHQEGMKFEAKTAKSSFVIDCPTISPIEYFLAGLICCTATDIVMVPKKQGIDVTDLVIDGDVVRAEEMPQKFDALHLDYNFNSSADDDTAARWVMASIETYCSTLNTVRGVTKITYSITHNGKKIRDKAEIISGESVTDFGALEGCCPS